MTMNRSHWHLQGSDGALEDMQDVIEDVLEGIEAAEKRLAEIRSRMTSRMTKGKSSSISKSVEEAIEELDQAFKDNMRIADSITVVNHYLDEAMQSSEYEERGEYE